MQNGTADHTSRFVEANGIRMHVLEQGTGPAVLLCHGFPECAYSYRAQLPALAGAGYRALAPDLRGYGQTERPEAVEQYTLLHLVGDLIGLLDALEIESAVLVGHDWGGTLAWNAALLRPDRFRAIVALGQPFRPRPPVRPTSGMPQTPDQIFYQLYFQDPRVADELGRDARRSLQFFFAGVSGEAPDAAHGGFNGMVSRGADLFSALPALPNPAWLSDEVLGVYASEFARSGFAGGLAWYRAIDRSWELLAPFRGLKVMVPALFIGGDRDPNLRMFGIEPSIAQMQSWVPGLREPQILAGCGHWTQQERPDVVNDSLLAFLKDI